MLPRERIILFISLLLNIIFTVVYFFKPALNKILEKLWEERKIENKRVKEMRFNNIYAPLRKLLIDTHITSAYCVRYPYFRQRTKRFISFWKNNEYKKALKSLFDKGISKSIGIDYGDFPLSSIEQIIKDNISCCDSKLVSLLQAVLRLQYEFPVEYRKNPRDLCEEEILLINHIFNGYSKLSQCLLK